MNRRLSGIAVVAVLPMIALIALGDAAQARGGASNIMNSPGYQRRLQESRGYVTNQSGSILTLRPARMYHGRRWKRR